MKKEKQKTKKKSAQNQKKKIKKQTFQNNVYIQILKCLFLCIQCCQQTYTSVIQHNIKS